MSRTVTPSQTIGPFFAVLGTVGTNELVGPDQASAITITGRVFDGDGAPVTDAMIELWQANEHGKYDHPEDTRELPLTPGFTGFGQCFTDRDGRFTFRTLKPGPVPFRDDRTQAPHINVSVFARGLLNRLVTRIYFSDETEANAVDPLLLGIDDPEVRATLVARNSGLRTYEFEVHLRGEKETAFLAI